MCVMVLTGKHLTLMLTIDLSLVLSQFRTFCMVEYAWFLPLNQIVFFYCRSTSAEDVQYLLCLGIFLLFIWILGFVRITWVLKKVQVWKLHKVSLGIFALFYVCELFWNHYWVSKILGHSRSYGLMGTFRLVLSIAMAESSLAFSWSTYFLF